MHKSKLSSAFLTLRDPLFWKTALPLALPITLQNLLTSSFQIVDTLMVGQLGDTVIAAVGIAGQVAFFINLLFYGISAGGAVFIAQFWGAGNHRGIRHVYGLMLSLTLPVILIFIAACSLFSTNLMAVFTDDAALIEIGARYLRIACWSYLPVGLNQVFCIVLRSTEEVRLPMVTGIFSVILNAAANYALIFGKFGLPALGVEGAAIATVLSAFLGTLLVFLISLSHRNMLCASLREIFSFDRRFAGKYIHRSLPVLINEGLWSLGVLGYNMVFGRLGADNYAALTIFRTIENLGFVFFIGICNACAVLVGKNIGAGRIDEAKKVSGAFMLLVPLAGITVGLLLVILSSPILSLFNVSPYVRRTAHLLLYFYAADIGIRNIPYISVCGIFRAGGDTKIGVKYDIGCLYGFSLPLVILSAFVLQLPFLAVYIIMLLAEDLPKSFLCIRRFLTYTWIKPVTDSVSTLSE
ncbi:MAG: MATE family efflux transporter [Clostridiaceae bacterium]|nr:MATE family efflux transporter [Clostridiaceae bacterium]